jgi:hypothetical protein
MVVLDLLAATPGVPEDQLLGFGSAPWSRGFGWSQPGVFDMSIRQRHRREYGCRLLTFNEPATHRLMSEGKTGGLADADYALGLLVDVDSNQRRVKWPPGAPHEWDDSQVRRFYDDDDEACEFKDFHEYPPTIARALSLVEDVSRPTVAIDGGGGCPCVFLFTEAVPVAEVGAKWLSRLSRRCQAVFGAAVVADGWHFDSPHPLTGWLRLPGSVRPSYGGHRVALLHASGPRYSLADIEAIAGPDDGKPLPSFGYWEHDTWNGAPIARPRDDGGTPPHRSTGGFQPQRSPFKPTPSPWKKTS